MWKEEYKLGNELIDAQHEELFRRVSILLGIITGKDAASHKKECIDAILFLKDYAVKHFAAEEAFQESQKYRFTEFHRAIHSSFISSVLEAEKKLVETDFSLPAIKEFCGFLSMWLIYHVAGADQKIVTDEVITVAEFAITVSYEDCVRESLKGVLDTILGDSVDVTLCEQEDIKDAVVIKTEYDESRMMLFRMPKQTALDLVSTISDMQMTDVDELAYAALTQLAETICGNTVSHFGKRELPVNDIKAQEGSIIDNGEFYLRTKYGPIGISLESKS